MPTDIQSVVYDALWTRILAGIATYNAAATGLGLVPINSPKEQDDRTDGRTVARTPGMLPGSFPRVRLELTGGDRQKTVTPTFGLAQGAACDAIMPRKVKLVQTIVHHESKNDKQTPLEAHLDAALEAAPMNLGIAYCRGFTWNDIRRDEKVDGVMRTVRRRTITVDLWPHLATVQ